MADKKVNRSEPDKKKRRKRTPFQKIVNVFLYIGLGLFILFLIAFGFSQTSTFRNYLRETLIENADSFMNGDLYIGEINGTIFTSVILNDVSVSYQSDTLLSAETIILKTSPLQLLLKTIHVRYFEIRNAQISLTYDKQGELVINKLFPPSQDEDTSESSFPFNIEVAEFRLNNVDFLLQSFENKQSAEVYKSLNSDDLRINNINLQMEAFADIDEKEFELEINKFYAEPNITSFNLRDLEGNFLIKKDLIEVKDFSLSTNNSQIVINSSLRNFNLFDSTSSIQNANIQLDLTADSLNLNDLSAFVSSTNILKGDVYLDIETSGTFSNMAINHLEINYDSTQLKAEGSIQNVTNPDLMYISVDFFDTHINQSDINNLLPSLDIPTYEQLGVIRFDTLFYDGNPLNFNVNFYAKTLKGDLSAKGNLDLRDEVMRYDISFKTVDFNISPFIGIVSNLNTNGSVKGAGTDPKQLNAIVNFKANGSTIGQINFDTLSLQAAAESKIIDYDLLAVSGASSASLNGLFNFTNEIPAYEAEGLIKNLDAAKFSTDSTFHTNLNFRIDAEGKSFELDELTLYLSAKLINSTVKKVSIDTARAIVDIGFSPERGRIINVISDLADITLTGNYQLSQAIPLLSSEASFISSSINEKLFEIFTSEDETNTSSTASVGRTLAEREILKNTKPLTLEYTIEFKDFGLLSVFLGRNHLEVDGNLNGEINSSADSIQIGINSHLDYIKYWGKDGVFFLSDMTLNTDIRNTLDADSFNDIFSELNFRVKRIFMGTEVKDASLDLKLSNSSALIDFSANYENYAYAKLLGKLDFQTNSLEINLDSLITGYNNFILRNEGNIDIEYSHDKISINNFVLARNDGEINIQGTLLRSGNQNLDIGINDFSGKEVSINMLGIKPSNALIAELNFFANVKGDFSAPIITSRLNIDSVSFKGKNFGNLAGKLNYYNRNINFDIRFLEPHIKPSYDSPLKIFGNIPYDLSFESVEERFVESKSMKITLEAEKFSLGAFANILPQIRQVKGSLTSKINITGRPGDLQPQGYLTLRNVGFIAAINNLEYSAGLKLFVEPTLLTLDSLVIQNSSNTPGGGKLTGRGKAEMNNLNIVSSEISVDGRLKVLAEESESASPSLYGDLVISTNGNINFKFDENGAYLEAPIEVLKADLVFPPTQESYSGSLNNFIYKFYKDTAGYNENLGFEDLVELSHMNDSTGMKNKNTKFDYKISVSVEEEARIVFILSKALNQKLTAILKGNFQYEKINGRPDAQGELRLLEGSTLEFIKTLSATGSIRFESEIDNPYLDITAVYTDFIYVEEEASSSSENETDVEEIPVAVKIRIEGPLKELDKNLIQVKDNIAVYVGENNIENNNPSPQYDVSDAIAFIAIGKFLDQGGAGSSDPFASTTTSIAGSILGGFLSSYLGDYVRSVQLRRVGTSTKVSLNGRINEFRYSIGGTTDVFNDLGLVNVRIEYPITESLLVRLEREEAIGSESTITEEMILELGLKYKFEF